MIGGHGHVRPRPDGVRARCGGPVICGQCAREQAEYFQSRLADPGLVKKAVAVNPFLETVLKKDAPTDAPREDRVAAIAFNADDPLFRTLFAQMYGR